MQKFGKYYLLEKITTGGMAEVFRAVATGPEGFQRVVAIKKILPCYADEPEFVAMFVDEASIAARLTHANIAQIFDFDILDGVPYIAMEFVEGKDLRSILTKCIETGERIPYSLAVKIAMEVATGLYYAHSRREASRPLRIIHRDVSPQNIMVSRFGEVKIVDFGIAKAADRVAITSVGRIKGKTGYMSPEQAMGYPLDHRTDVFSLGIVLWESLATRRLFSGDNEAEVLMKLLKKRIPLPTEFNPDVPESVCKVVMKALQRERTDRYANMLLFYQAMEEALQSEEKNPTAQELSQFMFKLFPQEMKLLEEGAHLALPQPEEKVDPDISVLSASHAEDKADKQSSTLTKLLENWKQSLSHFTGSTRTQLARWRNLSIIMALGLAVAIVVILATGLSSSTKLEKTSAKNEAVSKKSRQLESRPRPFTAKLELPDGEVNHTLTFGDLPVRNWEKTKSESPSKVVQQTKQLAVPPVQGSPQERFQAPPSRKYTPEYLAQRSQKRYKTRQPIQGAKENDRKDQSGDRYLEKEQHVTSGTGKAKQVTLRVEQRYNLKPHSFPDQDRKNRTTVLHPQWQFETSSPESTATRPNSTETEKHTGDSGKGKTSAQIVASPEQAANNYSSRSTPSLTTGLSNAKATETATSRKTSAKPNSTTNNGSANKAHTPDSPAANKENSIDSQQQTKVADARKEPRSKTNPESSSKARKSPNKRKKKSKRSAAKRKTLAPGTVVIQAQPYAYVTFKGKKIGTTPIVKKLPPGKYTFVLQYFDSTKTCVVRVASRQKTVCVKRFRTQ